MKAWTSLTSTLVAAGALVLGGLTAPASADGGGDGGGHDGGHDGGRGAAVVLVQDRCDPATFNAAIPATPPAPPTCVAHPKGNVTFNRFVSSIMKDPAGVLSERNVRGWRFRPDDLTIGAGQSLVAKNVGGEFHTFTPVTQYSGGCVGFLNGLLGLPFMCPPFAANTALPPGATLNPIHLAAGHYRFQCLIHPWMRTDVTVLSTAVRADDD